MDGSSTPTATTRCPCTSSTTSGQRSTNRWTSSRSSQAGGRADGCVPDGRRRSTRSITSPKPAALAHSDAAHAGRELRTAPTDPDARATPADPVMKVPLAEPEANASPREASDDCVLTEECIDQYLWSVYERAPKVDTIKVEERIKE